MMSNNTKEFLKEAQAERASKALEEKAAEPIVEETIEKAPRNVLDILLGGDMGSVKLPTKQYELTRLSRAYGSPFIVTLKALSADKWEEVQDMALSIKGKDVDVDNSLLQLYIVMESTYSDPEAKNLLFKNKELMSKFKAVTPKDLVRKILISGEILNVYNMVSELSGFGDDAVKEIKN